MSELFGKTLRQPPAEAYQPALRSFRALQLGRLRSQLDISDIDFRRLGSDVNLGGGGLITGVLGRLLPSPRCLFDAGRRFACAKRSASAHGEEPDEEGSPQQNDANDQPQSCRIHRLILGEDGPVARLSDRGWTRSA